MPKVKFRFLQNFSFEIGDVNFYSMQKIGVCGFEFPASYNHKVPMVKAVY